jgi:hypothetical protein
VGAFDLVCISSEPITKITRAKGLKCGIDRSIISFKILAASMVNAAFTIEDAHMNFYKEMECLVNLEESLAVTPAEDEQIRWSFSLSRKSCLRSISEVLLEVRNRDMP